VKIETVSLRQQGLRWVVALFWLAFIIRGGWYCALLPAWEGYDEPFHFAALQHVASGNGLPHADTPISLEVQKSLHVLPLPWMLAFHDIPQPLTPHEEFWKLPPEKRWQYVNAARALNPEEGSQAATEPIVNYESQQPPLYYWLFAIALRSMSSLSLLSRLYLLRFVNVLMASLAIPMADWIAKRVVSGAQAVGVTGIIVLLPELMINVARVGNESLALVFYTAILAAAVMAIQKPLSWRAWFLLGAALGCALLTKAYILSAIPGVILVAVASLRRQDQVARDRSNFISVGVRLACGFAVAACIAGAWYARVHRATGSWTGVVTDAAVGRVSLLTKLQAVSHVNWKSGVLSILISHVWFGAWSFLRVPVAVYLFAFAVIATAACGVMWGLLRRRGSAQERRIVIILATFYACFWAGLLYEVLIDYMAQGVSASAGWYLYAAVAAEIPLLVWGLQAFFPPRVVFPGLALGIAALDLYGMHAQLMPYYTGLTSHQGKFAPSALGLTVTHLPTVFQRLAQLRPLWLPVPVLVIAWIGCSVATIGTAAVVVVLFRGRFAND
jgi:4-amino-4-deoxy-L-arabinose transferase-like glycosyltransferase